MPPVGFEPTISAGQRPQTYALDSAVTGTGKSTAISLNEKVKQSHYRPGQAPDGSKRLRLPDFKIIGT